MKLAFSGLADKKYYDYIAKYCIPSWKYLPGDRYIVHDSTSINFPFVECVPWESIVNLNSNFLNTCDRTKPINFWKKMQSQVWALRNLKQYDWLILLDTDIEIINFNYNYFFNLLDKIKEDDFVWATGESQKEKLDAGHIIFNMNHPLINEITTHYENIWETGDIFKLERHYDGHAVESMFEKYPSYKIKNTDYGTGFHVYDIGTVHYGSKLPKAIRAAWNGENILDLIEQMKIDKFKFIDEYGLKGKF